LRVRADPSIADRPKYGGKHRRERLMEVRRLFFAAYHHVLPHTVLPPLPTTATTATATDTSPVMSPTPSPPSSPSYVPLPSSATSTTVTSITTTTTTTLPASAIPVSRSASNVSLANGSAGCGIAATMHQSNGATSMSSRSSDAKSNMDGSPAKTAAAGWFSGWVPGLT
jgi:cytoskeletal protein RodZ